MDEQLITTSQQDFLSRFPHREARMTNHPVLIVRRQVFPLGKLLAFMALSLADLILTWTLLQLNGGNIYETNPIANAWLVRYGWLGLMLFKSMTVLLFTSTCLLVFHYRPGKAAQIINLGCFLVGAVVLYSLFLLRAFP